MSFGEPVPVSGFLRQHKKFFVIERSQRLALVKEFADDLLRRIGAVVPVTPVCITAKAIMMIGSRRFEYGLLLETIIELRRKLLRDKRRIVEGRAFLHSKRIHDHLQREKGRRQKELVAFEEDFLGADDAREMAGIALDIMKRRGFLKIHGSEVIIAEKYRAFIAYYSNLLNYE